MRILSLKKKTLPKIAVLAAGLAVATMAATAHSTPAQAFPTELTACTSCHTKPGGTVTGVPSNPTPAASAPYTVLITVPVNPTGADTGYRINDAAGVAITNGGDTGTSAATYTANMTAPAAAGTYVYTVWGVNGPFGSTGMGAFNTYSITVAAAPGAVTTTTTLAVTPASPRTAPASPTLTATVVGAGAAGTVQFLNGTTVLGTSPVAAGNATLALTGVGVGNYSYTAKFIPTNATLFTASTSSAVAYVVTAVPSTAVATTTTLAVTPASPVAAPASPTLKATVTTGAAGTVQFLDGTTALGAPVTVVGGIASKTLTGVVAGTHSYKAVFTPTSLAAFQTSTSSALAYVVTGSQVAVTPVGGVATGDGSTSIG